MAPVQHYVPQFLLRNFCAGAKPKIYLPVSSTRTLAFFCRSHEEMVRDGVERMRTIMVRDSGHSMGFGDLLKWRRAFRTGVPLSSSPDNVLNHNSLQVHHAERYVFSSQPDFELVESMITDDPRFRVGPRRRHDGRH